METVWTPWAATGACVNLASYPTQRCPHAYVSTRVKHDLLQILSHNFLIKVIQTQNTKTALQDWAIIKLTESIYHCCMLVSDVQTCSYKSCLTQFWNAPSLQDSRREIKVSLFPLLQSSTTARLLEMLLQLKCVLWCVYKYNACVRAWCRLHNTSALEACTAIHLNPAHLTVVPLKEQDVEKEIKQEEWCHSDQTWVIIDAAHWFSLMCCQHVFSWFCRATSSHVCVCLCEMNYKGAVVVLWSSFISWLMKAKCPFITITV